MKIATLNIDWARKYKSKKHYIKIEDFLNDHDFDFLILTEAININLRNYNYKYFSEQLPEDITYEKLNYSEYLNGEKAFRTAIYSKTPFKRKFQVKDDKTSLALEFETEFGDLVMYATIIGTRYKENPFAKNELANFISDCEEIYKSKINLIIVGDLNTSFLKDEKKFSINDKTTLSLEGLFEKLNLINTTNKIIQNIDHIIIPMHLKCLVKPEVFVEKNELSDHAGICISLIS